MFARRIRVEVVGAEGSRPCPLEWLDSFCMRSFTGPKAFDETLPSSDGLLEAGLRVDLQALQADMEDWLTRKFGAGRSVKLSLSEMKSNQPRG